MKPIQRLVLVLAGGALACAGVQAAELASGFYGGITSREGASEQGVSIGDVGNAARFGPTLVAPRASQSLVFGGYRWGNDLALEASVGSVDDYRLTGRGGVGLVLPSTTPTLARSWNVDLVGSWSFWRSFSLYGRLGYAQADPVQNYTTTMLNPADRRYREGLQYGLGLRYDLGRSLGLKVEYARGGQHAADYGVSVPESDQVQFGLQFRF